MTTTTTTRCNTTLIIYNGFGSSFGTYFSKGTKLSDIIEDLKTVVRARIANGSDKYNRDRMTYAKLISDKTEKVIREWSERELNAMLS